MADSDAARLAILNAIEKMAPEVKQARSLNELAEALAWVRDAGQSHGGSTQVRSS